MSTIMHLIQQELSSPEELSKLSFGQIDDRIATLRRFIEQTSNAVGRASQRRDERFSRAEMAMLPMLTVRVYRQLAARHPQFATPARTTLALAHAKLWGIFNRRGTVAALCILRAEFCDYLQALGFADLEERELRQLEDKLARLRDELFRFEQLELMQPQRGHAVPLDELALYAA
jgi:uncharacterized small protein (DUF1192 family)